MDYQRTAAGALVSKVNGVPWRFAADDLRRERTGIHARVMVLWEREVLAHDNCNIERDPERVRLANSAWTQLPDEIQKQYSKIDLKHDLDKFCIGAWPAHVDELAVEMVSGKANSEGVLLSFPPYVVEGGGTIIFGQPGGGKSWTMMLMAVSSDSGVHRIWNGHKRRRGLFVNLERPRQSLEVRLACINRVLGLSEDRELPTINARGKSLSDIRDAIHKGIRQHGIEIVWLDSISRAGLGDLNSNESANRVIDMLNGFGVSWAALAHSPRGDDSHIYGSMHFEAGADVMVRHGTLLQADGTRVVTLEVDKANDMRFPEVRRLAYEFDRMGLSSVREATQMEAEPEQEDERGLPPMREDFAVLIDKYISEHNAGTATQIWKALGGKPSRPTIQRHMTRYSKGKGALYKAIEHGKEVYFEFADS